MKTLINTTILAIMLLGTPFAFAIEPLTAKVLQDVCNADGQNRTPDSSSLCVFYIKGFLDGAVATDGRVAENVAREADEESFSERAIRTRVIDRLNKFGPSVYAEFCIGQPDPIADVVAHVIQRLSTTDNLAEIQAQAVVYGALREHYPCVED